MADEVAAEAASTETEVVAEAASLVAEVVAASTSDEVMAKAASTADEGGFVPNGDRGIAVEGRDGSPVPVSRCRPPCAKAKRQKC